MRQSSSIAALAPALIKAQGELKAIPKDSVNPHFKNKYASLEAITEYVRPILVKHGLAIVQGGEEVNGSGVQVSTMLVHTSGEWISTGYPIPLEKATAQSAGSAISYGRRYGLSSLLALTTDDDDDGERASAPKKAEPPKPAKKLASEEQRGQLAALAADEALDPRLKRRIDTLLKGELDEATATKAIKETIKSLNEGADK